VRASVNRLEDVAVMYKIPFLAFKIQHTPISLARFTELITSLTLHNCIQRYVDKII